MNHVNNRHNDLDHHDRAVLEKRMAILSRMAADLRAHQVEVPPLWRASTVVACRNLADGVQAAIEPSVSGPREVIWCLWLLAADGAHSTDRQQLGIDFVGSSFTNHRGG